MKKIITLIYLIGFCSLILMSCSEIEENINSPTKPGIHGEGALDINSPDFHGKLFTTLKFRDCQNCHAKNFQGGLTPVNCASAGCHPAINIHVDSTGAMNPNSPNFHGRYLLKNTFTDCQQCHGESFEGGLSSPSCTTCHSSISVHKAGLIDPASPNFHGKNPLSGNFANCQSCHGENFAGGISSPSCITCHSAVGVHKVGIVDTASVNFHGKYKLSNGFADCQGCHGQNFSGGNLSPTCVTCHSSISVHKSGIKDSTSANFHGKNPLTGEFSNCQPCHGVNFSGGNSSPSCVTCHSAISVHKDGINNPASSNFHGKNPVTKNLADCQPCHGDKYAGGTLSPSCASANCHATAISVHQTGIMVQASPNFHGKYPLPNGFKDCQQCHGENFSGGSISPTCTTCHSTINVHKEGILNPSSPDFHGKFLANNGWNLPNCKQCHGSNYGGGSISTSCLSCHNQPNGPEACNTCHGDFNNPARIAPPQDLSGNSNTSAKGVGAHEKHLYTSTIGKSVECESCHNIPQSLDSFGHLDGNLPAELNLKGLAVFNIAANASYSSSNLTCTNTYCHGNFAFNKADAPVANQFAYSADKMEGNNRSVIWNKVDGSEAECGSCHGLPPTGHIDFGGLTTCVNCHQGVVNGQGQITNSGKHINGVVNVFGN